MIAEVYKSALCGEVTAPPSKSYAIRYMIASLIAAYHGGESAVVKNVGTSDDVLAVCDCLNALGLNAKIENGDFYANGYSYKRSAVLNVRESGAALRFLLPIAAAIGVNAEFVGSERLFLRPVGGLKTALEAVGVTLTRTESGIKTTGKIRGSVLKIDGTESSQYVSGGLFASALSGGKFDLYVRGEKSSAGYIDITVSVLREFGVEVYKNENCYEVRSDNINKGKITAVTERDYSGAAAFLAAGAINGAVCVKGLKNGSLQPDFAILDLLKGFGANVEFNSYKDNGYYATGVTVKKREESGLKKGVLYIDVNGYPDLAQIIAVVAAVSCEKCVISGAYRLKYKESDRFSAIIDLLSAAGIKTEKNENSLVIYGGKPRGFEIDAKNDHRTVFAAVILASVAEGKSVINGAEAVKKSYPDFFENFKILGGKFNVNV